MSIPATPDAALLGWVKALPAVRCVAPAFRPWTKAADAAVVPVTSTDADRFGAAGFPGNVVIGFTTVAGSKDADTYFLARVPSARAVILHAGSDAQEESFTAVLADAGSPPTRVAPLAAAPRAHGLGLGSTRTAVEGVLGAGRAKRLCGFDVVRYEVRPAVASDAEMWFFYRAGVVVAFARYEAV